MNYALILAGGTGSRAGGDLPKQFQMVHGKRMLTWSILAFRKFDPECRIIVAIHPDYMEFWSGLKEKEEDLKNIEISSVNGGKSRLESVRNGLTHIMQSAPDSSEAKVFIHDAARPFVTPGLIRRGSEKIVSGKGLVPVIPVTDSLRRVTAKGSEAVDRNDYRAVQTPQIFMLDDIVRAYEGAADASLFTDDASVAEKAGIEILTFEGDPANIKITTPSDFRNL